MSKDICLPSDYVSKEHTGYMAHWMKPKFLNQGHNDMAFPDDAMVQDQTLEQFSAGAAPGSTPIFGSNSGNPL